MLKQMPFVLLALGSLAIEASAMEFAWRGNGGNCDSCEWISAEGEIESETPMRFREFIEKSFSEAGRRPYLIYFDSPGGVLGAGPQLGEIIRKSGGATAVGRSMRDGFGNYEIQPGRCASSCAFAFLGGVTRYAKPGEVGVHQFYDQVAIENPTAEIFDSQDVSEYQLLTGLLVAYVHRMGVDPRFVTVAAATPPTEMHYFGQEELELLKVSWDGEQFKPWQVEAYRSGAVAFSENYRGDEKLIIFCRSDKKPRFMFSATRRASDAELSIDHIDGYQIADSVAKRRTLTLKVEEGWSISGVLEKAPAVEPEIKSFGIGVFSGDVGSRADSWMDRTVNASGAHPAIRLALRNCI